MKMKRMLTACLAALVVSSMAALSLAGCGDEKPISNSAKPTSSTAQAHVQGSDEKEYEKSNAKNDTDVGLRNIKIDTAERELTDDQKAVLAYFDEDYLTVPNYEFLKRYPDVFEQTQLSLSGSVEKVFDASESEYKVLLKLVQNEGRFFYRSMNTPEDYENYLERNQNSLVLLTVNASGARMMEGDYVYLYGRCHGLENIEIDSVSHSIPSVSVYQFQITRQDEITSPEKYDLQTVKQVAKAIFGNDIEIREPVIGEDLDEDTGWKIANDHFYLVELENQSNAKFTKYRFYTQRGKIEDAKTGSDSWILDTNPDIDRRIEFSSDFEHYFIFTYDHNLEQLNLDYYDKDLNKIWNREFEETTSAIYDYTKNNIYLVANNELYIINTETGEDTYAPAYVGAKQEIRKLRDGILVVSQNKSDGIMKLGLDGTIIWKTNLADHVSRVTCIELIDDTIVVQLSMGDGEHYLVLDAETGSVQTDAERIN